MKPNLTKPNSSKTNSSKLIQQNQVHRNQIHRKYFHRYTNSLSDKLIEILHNSKFIFLLSRRDTFKYSYNDIQNQQDYIELLALLICKYFMCHYNLPKF